MFIFISFAIITKNVFYYIELICIFAYDKLHLGIACKQACISALGLHYLCNNH